MPSSHLILCRCRPLLLLPPIPPSIRVFSNESILRMRWPKFWSFSFSIIPSKEIPGLISFRMDWLALLAVQGTRKSLLQHHSSKASILWRSAFLTVQLSHPYMTTGKNCSCIVPLNLVALNNHCTLPWDFVALELRQRSAGWFFCSTWYPQRSLSVFSWHGPVSWLGWLESCFCWDCWPRHLHMTS